MIDSGTVRLIATANDMERAGLAVVAYYLRLYAVERLLSGAGVSKKSSDNDDETCAASGTGARSEEVTAAATDLLDQIETFKQAAMGDDDPESQGVKVLLSDSGKAMVYFLNFAMSLYNDKLSQVSTGPYDRTLRQGLWCCIDLFNAVVHIWSKELKDPSKIADRVKYCKVYLSKLAKGELKAKQTEEEQESELDVELNKLIQSEDKGEEETGKDEELDYKDFIADEVPGEDLEVDQVEGTEKPEEEVKPEDVDDLIEKLKLEEDEPPIEFPKKEFKPDVEEGENDDQQPTFSLPSAPASKPEYRDQPTFLDTDEESEEDTVSKGSIPPADEESSNKNASVVRSTTPEKDSVSEKKQYSSNDLMAMMDKASKIEKVQRSAKYAISALNYEDISTARAELTKALQLLDSL